MNNKKKFIIVGGSKGIGFGIANKAFELNYEIIFFAKNKPLFEFNHKYYFLDIEDQESLNAFDSKLNEFSNFNSHYLFCTGGGLSSKNDDPSINTLQKVWWHNCGFPIHIILKLRTIVSQPTFVTLLFSTVAINFKGSIQYSSSKSALESGFHTLLRESSNPNLYLTAIRLGFVDVEHKYFHKFSEESPVEFKEILKREVPTNHFMKIDSIANIIMSLSNLGQAANGCIIDLSNGTSWT